MRRWLGWIAIGWLLLVCALALVAYGATSSAQTLDQRTQAIASQLRCPVCQGETIADSQADIAVAIRVLIRRELRAGESPNQITSFLLSRYPNIALTPASSGIGSVAWVAPPLLLLGGAGLLVTLIVDWRGRGNRTVGSARGVYLERVRREIADGEGQNGD